MRLDLSLILQITLVGNHDNREEILVLHLNDQYLVTERRVRSGPTLKIC